VAFQGDQAVIGDRHAVGIAAEVTENVLGATEGRFAVDHPVVTEEGAEERSESLRFREKLEVPVEAELAVVEGLPEREATNLPRKTRLSTFLGRKKR